VRDIEARLIRLEAAAEGTELKMVALFGDDPVPEGVTERTVILRFDEEDRGL